ncbi:MAG TPA: OmpA family protein [Polyangiales bacterium]|nr:OmpA family protein [Polyangiales bacterium]
MSAVSPNQTPRTARKAPAQHTPSEHEIAETIEWAEPQPRRKSSAGAWIVAVTATLLAVGLGYVASEQWRARESALASLSKTHIELQSVMKDRAAAQQSATEQQKLVDEQRLKLEADSSELTELKAKLGATEARLAELETQSEALNAHLAEFKSLSKQFQRMIDSGKLEINFRRGRMIVELPAAVLFASGSAELSADGRTSLQEIAKILRKVPGKRFMIGGHTDDVPIGKGSTYSSNWSLSAARAVTVTEALIQSGLRANHLAATGYGEYDPIASNGNDKGRVKNRRIEIVLEPDFAGLPNALADLKKDAKSKQVAKR